MSVNDIPRNSFNGMEKRSLPPLALPEYSGPGTSGTGYTNTGAPGITTAEHVQDLGKWPFTVLMSMFTDNLLFTPLISNEILK